MIGGASFQQGPDQTIEVQAALMGSAHDAGERLLRVGSAGEELATSHHHAVPGEARGAPCRPGTPRLCQIFAGQAQPFNDPPDEHAGVRR